MGCNYLSLPLIPASGTALLIYIVMTIPQASFINNLQVAVPISGCYPVLSAGAGLVTPWRNQCTKPIGSLIPRGINQPISFVHWLHHGTRGDNSKVRLLRLQATDKHRITTNYTCCQHSHINGLCREFVGEADFAPRRSVLMRSSDDILFTVRQVNCFKTNKNKYTDW